MINYEPPTAETYKADRRRAIIPAALITGAMLIAQVFSASIQPSEHDVASAIADQIEAELRAANAPGSG